MGSFVQWICEMLFINDNTYFAYLNRDWVCLKVNAEINIGMIFYFKSMIIKKLVTSIAKGNLKR